MNMCHLYRQCISTF